jgi:hypothetical protein
MTVSNLVVLGSPGLGGDPPLGQNILLLNGAGNTPLTVLSTLTVGNDGVVFVSNSILNTMGDEIINGLGSLFLTSGTNNAGNSLTIGDGTSGAALWMTGGSLFATNTYVNAGGMFVQSNGVASIVDDERMNGSSVVAGGTQSFLVMFIGDGSSQAGNALVTGGQMTFTSIYVELGTMIVSNGNLNGDNIAISSPLDSSGTLTIAGGTISLQVLSIATTTANGTVWMTGGSVVASSDLFIALRDSISTAAPPIAVLIQSNGTLSVRGEYLAVSTVSGPTPTGTLTVAGGTHLIGADGFTVGQGGSGTVWLVGGQLIVTNGSTLIGNGIGVMTVSNGTWIARDVLVGGSFGEGTLTFLGGSSTILSNMTLGNCGADALGSCRLSGGSLFVTNATHNAVLDVRNSDFLITAGHLVVDTLVMTNDCGLFIHAGGTVSARTLLLDPDLDADGDGLPNGWEIAHGLDPLDSSGINGADGDPDGDGYSNLQEYLAGSDPQNPASTPSNLTASFAFTSIARTGNNIVLMWNTIGGTTNQIQVSPGSVGASYSTNSFTNLGPQMFITGSGAVITNFTDTNGATNKPSRYYRIRLVP